MKTFEDTLDHFEERGFALVGGGRNLEQARQPLILERNGSRIGWLACNNIGPYYAFANDDPDALGGAAARERLIAAAAGCAKPCRSWRLRLISC